MAAPPILVWRLSPTGRMLAASPAAPPLPTGSWLPSGRPDTVQLGHRYLPAEGAETRHGWLVAGQSLASTAHIQRVLLAAETVAAPVLLVTVFLGALVIGLKASGPVEQARRRQLEFTADASHELRTPLSVIEAETGLALSTPRDAGQYQTALQRVSRESQRLRSIVDNLLWLARFDSEPANPANEPVDVFDDRRDLRRQVLRCRPLARDRPVRAPRGRAGGLDHRPARMDGPAHRRTRGQRLPLRRGCGSPGRPSGS